MIVLMIVFFTLSLSSAFAEDNSSNGPSTVDIVGDAVWIRPVGFIGTALSAIAYVVSLPVTIPLNKKEEAKEFLITDPYNFYFKRPLGEM